ncbi:MAG: adenylosuccinate lyase [bacterium]
MIERYSRKKMKDLWSLENKFQKWLDIEIAACEAHETLGNITKESLKTIKDKAKFDVPGILKIEAEIHHDVIAFLTNVASYIGPDSRFVHLGLTSSDVVDTAFALLIREAGELIQKEINVLIDLLKTQAYAYKETLMMGRTHGVHAEPMTLGLKLAVWAAELKRHQTRLTQALEDLRVGKVSGAVGNYAHMPPSLEKLVCEKLTLSIASVSTQILQRDRHAAFINCLAMIGGTLEKMAVEIRLLQKTECNEIMEPFSKLQKGSSAMPHKRNPITCERITGLARVLRGYAVSAMENQALWHERDISHSSAERIIFPDACIGLDYMLSLMQKVIKGMQVNEKEMQRNIDQSYHVFFSQKLLLELINKGMLREDAYRLVQRNAHKAFDEKVLFETLIQNEDAINNLLSKEELANIFSFKNYCTHNDQILERVFNH